ncbi:MAG: hypothetical protein IKY52_07925, partial [Clostridia bacterium]|nr:hypothetical protein [Clostridia bacterium]
IGYTVYNFDKNTVETRLSESTALKIGKDYRTGSDGCITAEKAEHIENGFVSGFTAATVTIDGTTHTLADSVNLISIDKDHKISKVNLGDLYMHHVEFVLDKGEVVLILSGSAPQFTASGEGREIVIKPDFAVRNFDAASLALKSLKKGTESVDTANVQISITEDGDILLAGAEAFAAGEYTAEFTLGGSAYTVTLTVTEPQQPESPEQPEEDPDQPENPDDSENDNDRPGRPGHGGNH